MLYGPPPMSTGASRAWFAACRRGLAAAVCALMLLAGLFPGHAATAQAMPYGVGQVVVGTMPQADGETPDAMLDYAACQCACQAASLPAPPTGQASMLVRPAPFAVMAVTVLHSGPPAPPAEPPRT